MTFECRLERRFPVAVATLSGQLDPAAAGEAVAVIRACLVDDQPVEMIIEVSGLTVPKPAALLPLLELVRCARRWPGTRVAFGGGGAAFAATVTEAAGGVVEVFPGVAEAVAAGQQRQVPARASADLLPTPQAPAACRELIARACQSWRITRLQGLAQLLASELVSNAVIHARTRFQVTIRHAPPALQVAVRDHDPRLVTPPPATGPDSPLADMGRGMLLLETLADDWGCIPTDDGKVVWASMAAPRRAVVSSAAA